MVTTKRSEPNEEDELPSPPTGRASIQDRIAAFAMLDAMTSKTQAEKSMRLRLIGFSNAESARMLQTTPAVVASNIYQEKKKAAKRATTPRKGNASEDATA